MPGNIAAQAAFCLFGRASPASEPPFLLWLRSSTGFILFTVCLAIFTDILFYGIVVPVLPFALTVQVGIPEEDVQTWTAILLACYNAALFVGAPIVGVYADRSSSRRWPLIIGLLALMAATLLLCLGKSIGVLIVGRLLQGLSASIVWSVGLALLTDTMGKSIGYAMGWVSIATFLGLLVSPVIGGAVYAAAGYYTIFYIAFGVIGCDVVLRLLLIEKKIARQWLEDESSGGPEAPAQQSKAAEPEAVAAAADRLSQEQPQPAAGMELSSLNKTAKGQNSAPAQPATSVAGEGTTSTSEVGSAAKHPHWELVKSTRILAALFGIIIEAGIMFSCDTVIPLFVKDTFGWTSTAAGLIFICIMIPGFLSPVVGIVSDRYGARWPSLAGFVLTVPLLICLRFVTENSIRHKVLLGALLALLGFASMAVNTPLMAEITYAIEAKEARHPGIWGPKGVYGIGYGLFTTAYAVGGAAGSLMSGYVVANVGWSTMTWSLAIWCASGAVVVGLWVGGRPVKKSAEVAGADSGAVQAVSGDEAV